jgi:hypothetical protein
MKSVIVEERVQQHFDALLARKAKFETGLVLGHHPTLLQALLPLH